MDNADDSAVEPREKAFQRPTRLRALAMVAVIVVGIASALIAQGIGLSFRLSIALSALIVGISIPIFHHFQDSGASPTSRSQHN